MNNRYTEISDEKNKIYMMNTKREIIIDSFLDEDVCVDIEKKQSKIYELLLKYYKLIFYKYEENKKYNVINSSFFKNNGFNFISDNSIEDFANIFIFSYSKNHIYLNTINKKDKILGSFILLTSNDNYGKYGDYFDIMSLMIDEIREYNDKKSNDIVKKYKL